MTSASAETLCTSCGLCCTSLIFRRVGVTHEEAAGLDAQRFHIFTTPRGNTYFHQPCPALKDKACSIYEHRPHECRKWKCKTLKRLEAGKIDIDEALLVVDKMRALSLPVIEDARVARGEDTRAINLQTYMSSRINDFLKNQTKPGYRRRNIAAIKRIRALLAFVHDQIWRQKMLEKMAKISNVSMVRKSKPVQKPRSTS